MGSEVVYGCDWPRGIIAFPFAAARGWTHTLNHVVTARLGRIRRRDLPASPSLPRGGMGPRGSNTADCQPRPWVGPWARPFFFSFGSFVLSVACYIFFLPRRPALAYSLGRDLLGWGPAPRKRRKPASHLLGRPTRHWMEMELRHRQPLLRHALAAAAAAAAGGGGGGGGGPTVARPPAPLKIQTDIYVLSFCPTVTRFSNRPAVGLSPPAGQPSHTVHVV